MSNSNVTPAPTAESIYQMLKERTLSQEAFGVDIDYVFTPSDRLETPLPLYVRRQPGIVGGISLLRYLTGYIPDPVSITSEIKVVLANGSILRHSRRITAIPEPPKPIVALWKRSLYPALIHLAIIAGILFAWIVGIIHTFDLPISR